MELEGARHEGIIIFSTSDKTLINWSDGDSVALLRPRDLDRNSHLMCDFDESCIHTWHSH